MNIRAKISIHNRFDIIVRDAETNEIIQRAQAENIVLDRMYSRLCNFQPFFSYIVFGSGTGTPTPDRTTLFNRIAGKSATTELLIRANPTSQWTRYCRLTSTEYNGQYIREIGISDNDTNINTHAMIVDAEGNPIELEKTAQKIIDLYATEYATIYDADWGLRFDGTGLRDYLTGGSIGSDTIAISFWGRNEDGFELSSTCTPNVANKSVKTTAKFRVEHFNNDIRFIEWPSVGLICELPRTGIEQRRRTGINLGAGDGAKTRFTIPNKMTIDNILYINGVQNDNWIKAPDAWNDVIFDEPVPNEQPVTADYTCLLLPKNENNEMDISMEIIFGGGQPSPVMPDPVYDYSGVPGASAPIGGDTYYGFWGEVTSAEFIRGADLCTQIGLAAGTLQNSDAGWLKFTLNGKMLLVAKKTFRHSISWNDINAVGAVFGSKILQIGTRKYIVRLLSTKEWDKLMYPIHVNHPDGAPDWYNYTDSDILVASGNGRATWTMTKSGSNRVYRGYSGVSDSYSVDPSYSSDSFGFRPVLELL